MKNGRSVREKKKSFLFKGGARTKGKPVDRERCASVSPRRVKAIETPSSSKKKRLRLPPHIVPSGRPAFPGKEAPKLATHLLLRKKTVHRGSRKKKRRGNPRLTKEKEGEKHIESHLRLRRRGGSFRPQLYSHSQKREDASQGGGREL